MVSFHPTRNQPKVQRARGAYYNMAQFAPATAGFYLVRHVGGDAPFIMLRWSAARSKWSTASGMELRLWNGPTATGYEFCGLAEPFKS
jgi:hypothetical protein